MLIAVLPKSKPVSNPSFKPLIHPPVSWSLYCNIAKPNAIKNIKKTEASIITTMPFVASGSLGLILVSSSHLLTNKIFEYYNAPNAKYPSAAQRMASQLSSLKNDVFMFVGLGLKRLNNINTVYRLCKHLLKQPTFLTELYAYISIDFFWRYFLFFSEKNYSIPVTIH